MSTAKVPFGVLSAVRFACSVKQCKKTAQCASDDVYMIDAMIVMIIERQERSAERSLLKESEYSYKTLPLRHKLTQRWHIRSVRKGMRRNLFGLSKHEMTSGPGRDCVTHTEEHSFRNERK